MTVRSGAASVARVAPLPDIDGCQRLSTFPERGTRRDDLRPGMRTLGYRRRVTIAFTVTDETVAIVAIL